MFAVDAGSTQAVAQTIQKYKAREKGMKGGGYDLLPKTLELLKADQIDFTIDQQAYLQGFYPVFQLFLTKMSGTLTGTGDMNTGLKFLTKDDAPIYLGQPVALRGLHEGTEGHPARVSHDRDGL
jgi:simple sugar transport system substrate-binding protein